MLRMSPPVTSTVSASRSTETGSAGSKAETLVRWCTHSCPSCRNVRIGKMHDKMKPSSECRVQVAAQIGCKDGQTVKLFHPLQEVSDFLIGVPIFGILDGR